MNNSGASKKLACAGLSCFFALSAGCANLSKESYFHDVHLSKTHMNRDAFKDVADFNKKLSQLKKGMPEADVFKTLKLDRGRFTVVPREERMKFLAGGAAPNPQTVKAITGVINAVNQTQIYTLQFKEVDEHGALKDFMAAQTENEGFDLRMMLIIQNGKLYDAQASGTAHVNGKEIDFVWGVIGEGLKGAALGGGAAFGVGLFR